MTIDRITTSLAAVSLVSSVATTVVLSAVTALALAVGWRRVRGTTLVAPWIWSIVALLAVTAVGLAEDFSTVAAPLPWLSAAHYLAAIVSCAPVMAVLGAKRPQAGAWQFIVIALLGVLALPAGVTLVLHYGEPVSLHAARQWFLAILVGIGLASYLPTRYVLSACLFFAAQLVVLGAYLPWDPAAAIEHRTSVGLALVAVASAHTFAPWKLKHPPQTFTARVWLDFRDAFGALWALRIMERVNGAAGGDARRGPLGWYGFTAHSMRQPASEALIASPENGVPELGCSETGALERANAERALLSLVRRFVSESWIAARYDTSGISGVPAQPSASTPAACSVK